MAGRPTMPAIKAPDMTEYGAERDGTKQSSTRRLFFQLQVYTGCHDQNKVISELDRSGLEFVLYNDVNDPSGVGILMMSANPENFTQSYRNVLSHELFRGLTLKPDMTMFGRTYAIGREQNLEDWLLEKPRRSAFNEAMPWTVWYPLRRKPEFALLSGEEHGKILMEHAMIGRSYGETGLVQDIRLACHGLDKNDNEFIIGLVSSDLHPLSRIVQDMRKTQQTAKYIQSLGPFFVGHRAWQSGMKKS